jgi:hypothetical protein
MRCASPLVGSDIVDGFHDYYRKAWHWSLESLQSSMLVVATVIHNWHLVIQNCDLLNLIGYSWKAVQG